MREVNVFEAGRLLYGGVVTILSSRMDRQSNFMAASWVCPLSTNPPLVGVSLTPSCWTHRLVRETGEFVLNIPDGDMVRLVHGCGTCSGRDVDKTRIFDIGLTGSRMVKPLRVVGSLGVLECEVRDWLRTGDRTLVVGEIVYAAADEECFDGHWLPHADVLRHIGGNRYQAGARIYEVRMVSPAGPGPKVIDAGELPGNETSA